MLKSRFMRLPAFLLIVTLMAAGLYAGKPEGQSTNKLAKTKTSDMYRTFLINNIFNYYSNNGDGSYNIYTSDGAAEYPKGSYGTVIFEEGLVWGLYQGGVKKVGGSTYSHGIQPGPIVTPGTSTTPAVAANASDNKYRLYRVRPDINPSTPFDDAMKAKLEEEEASYINRFETVTAKDIYDAYIADWNEWPADNGAPYKDVNGNGSYNPGTDIPGIPGADQCLWYVANDMDASLVKTLYGSTPVGIEVQTSIWGYSRTGALGSTVFVRYKVINKSGVKLDSMYFAQWSDPDLGGSKGYKDDFVGCDTVLKVGYVYNGKAVDGFYGVTVPSGGYVFFQGPAVPSPGSVGVFDLKYRNNIKNLGMSAFNLFINSNTTYADPRLNDPRGTDEWYNLMKGLVGRTGAQYLYNGSPSKFLLSGDPVTGKGWLDGTISAPDDRRMASITGPFSMAAGDTQEVCVALVIGQSKDRLASVSKMKFYVKQAQQAYDNLFVVPQAPAQPNVTAYGLNGEVVLDWSDPAKVALVETPVYSGYKFEGYNVYQASNAALDNMTRIETYDIAGNDIKVILDVSYDEETGYELTKPVVFGSDAGVKRIYRTTTDKLKSKALANYTWYYYAVTAYSYNPNVLVGKVLESQAKVIAVRPEPPKPGNAVNATYGTALSSDASRTTKTGNNDGVLSAVVVNPALVTGHLYVVKIDTVGGSKSWGVYDSTTQTMKVSKIKTWSTTDATNPIVDGIQFGVSDPGSAGGLKSVLLVQDGATPLATPVSVLRALSPDGNWFLDGAGSTSAATAITRLSWQGYVGTSDYEIRFTSTGSKYFIGTGPTVANNAAADRVPFEAWDVTRNEQLTAIVLDDNGNNKWDTTSAVALTNITAPAYERIYLTRTPAYSESAFPATLAAPVIADQPLGRIVFAPYETTGAWLPTVGSIVRFVTNKPLTVAHNWRVSTTGLGSVAGDNALKLSSVDKINVFPNPYFGYNPQEPNKYSRFVTFTHLPKKATIRIFALSGTLLRVISKDDDTQTATWDLNNSYGFPAASGVYVAYIDMPELGKTKTLKFSIIPMGQILDKY